MQLAATHMSVPYQPDDNVKTTENRTRHSVKTLPNLQVLSSGMDNKVQLVVCPTEEILSLSATSKG